MLRTYELLYSTLWTVSSSPRSPARNFSAKVLATVLGDLMFAELPPNQNSGLGNRVHFMSRELFCFSKPYSRGFVAVSFVIRRLRKTTLKAKSLVR